MIIPDISDNYVDKTIQISLFVQIVTGIVSLIGVFLKLPKDDAVLTDVMKLETIVQFVEATFYIWVMKSMMNKNIMTSRRYIDWVITTPTMLFSTILYMKYLAMKKKNEVVTTSSFIENNKANIQKIVVYNFLMLFFGYMGETGKMNKWVSVSLGSVFFLLSFYEVKQYADETEEGKMLYNVMFLFWGLYGVAAICPVNLKNTSYNILDIFSKNFYGLFLFYKILNISCKF